MNEIQLSAGPIEYTDTGGDGPVLVLLHGLMMDASLWDEVTACLAPGRSTHSFWVRAWRPRPRSGRGWRNRPAGIAAASRLHSSPTSP